MSKKWQDMKFTEQVDHVLKTGRIREPGEYDHTNDIIIGKTPDILLELGYKPYPLLYTKKHLLEAVKGTRYREGNVHSLSREAFLNVKSALNNPVACFESLSHPEVAILLTDVLDNNKAPVIASVLKDGAGWVDDKRIKANFVTSIYGKDREFGRWVDTFVESNKVIYCDGERLVDLCKRASVSTPALAKEYEANPEGEREEEDGYER